MRHKQCSILEIIWHHDRYGDKIEQVAIRSISNKQEQGKINKAITKRMRALNPGWKFVSYSVKPIVVKWEM